VKKLRIKLVRSSIGRPQKHKKIISSLGLRKLNKVVIKDDTPSIRGMINKVPHLLEVEEIQ
jgi:large subunit ribosomal protein L30